MAAATTAVAVGIAAAATVHQAETAAEARRQAGQRANSQRKAAKRAEAQAEKELKEIEAQEETDTARQDAVKRRRAAVSAQRGGRADAQGKGGTLLTGGQGLTNETTTLLGESGGQGVKDLLGV